MEYRVIVLYRDGDAHPIKLDEIVDYILSPDCVSEIHILTEQNCNFVKRIIVKED